LAFPDGGHSSPNFRLIFSGETAYIALLVFALCRFLFAFCFPQTRP
jgi:hypothetical protein